MSTLAIDTAWVDVCAVEDVPLRGARRIAGAGSPEVAAVPGGGAAVVPASTAGEDPIAGKATVRVRVSGG